MPNPTKPTTNLTREELEMQFIELFSGVSAYGYSWSKKVTIEEYIKMLHDGAIDHQEAAHKAMQLIDAYVKTEVNENSKAYGGCLDCYGKGYATQESATIGYPDFVGDKGFKHHEHKMIFCECPRGRQLRSEIDLQADKENL